VGQKVSTHGGKTMLDFQKSGAVLWFMCPARFHDINQHLTKTVQLRDHRLQRIENKNKNKKNE